MLRRETVSEWSVVAVGGLLLAVTLADWFHARGSVATAAVERALPALLAFGLIGFGLLLRRREMASTDIGAVALGTLAGAGLFLIIDQWLVFIIVFDEPMPVDLVAADPGGPTGMYPSLNMASIGAAGIAALTAIYIRFRRQNEQLERLTAELEERNERLDRQTSKLQAQNERLEQFASLVSHDLRNPLNVAQGRLELARETGDAEHFEATERAHDRMETLIGETLSLARHGTSVEETDEVGLASVAESAWETVATGEATLRVVDDDRFEADASRLKRAFENLFRNTVEHGSASPRSQAHEDAVEHGATGSRWQSDEAVAADGDAAPTVRVGVLDSGGFYVEDDGPGIPPEHRESVFEFGRSTATDGTGYGLAVVRAIVEAHGWSVEATESEDGGARFEVTTDRPDAGEA